MSQSSSCRKKLSQSKYNGGITVYWIPIGCRYLFLSSILKIIMQRLSCFLGIGPIKLYVNRMWIILPLIGPACSYSKAVVLIKVRASDHAIEVAAKKEGQWERNEPRLRLSLQSRSGQEFELCKVLLTISRKNQTSNAVSDIYVTEVAIWSLMSLPGQSLIQKMSGSTNFTRLRKTPFVFLVLLKEGNVYSGNSPKEI